jgi:hypothetical protein
MGKMPPLSVTDTEYRKAMLWLPEVADASVKLYGSVTTHLNAVTDPALVAEGAVPVTEEPGVDRKMPAWASFD